jgi:hypothetical protein
MRRLIGALLVGLGLNMAQPSPALADPEEWARAMVLMNAGETEAALPLLERLVSANPEDKNYRFELALALFRLGKDVRARWHLDLVRGADLTGPEEALVSRYLAEIAGRSVWSGAFSIALKPETNATQRTSDAEISVGGLDFTLTPESRAQPGVSVVVAAQLGYSPRLSERVKGRFTLTTNLRHNKERRLRDYTLNARAGLEYMPDTRSQIAGGVQLGYRWVGDQPYSDTRGLWGEYTRLIGQRGRLDLGLDLSRIGSKVGLADSDRSMVTFSYGHALTGNARVTVAGLWEDTRGAMPTLAGTRKALSITGLYAWDGGMMTSLRMGVQTDDRRGVEPVFGVTRKDRKTSLDLTIYHRDFRVGIFAPTLVIGVENNRSNVPLAAYKNRYISLGLTREF